jgi:hypothetical protein
MSLKEFITLDLQEQQRYLDDYAVLQGYIDTPNRVYLYQVSDFYVESHYVYHPEYKVTKIEAFDNMERLEPYLDQMDISMYVTNPGIGGSDK